GRRRGSWGWDVHFEPLLVERGLHIDESSRRRSHKFTLDSPASSGAARLTRSKNLRRCILLPPYRPASLLVVYSRIFCRASGGSCGDNNMRVMIAAERPEPLWLALRMVQVVLRASPRPFDGSSSVKNPASTRPCPTSLIFAACRAFISAPTGLLLSCNERSAWRLTEKVENAEKPFEYITVSSGRLSRSPSSFWTRGIHLRQGSASKPIIDVSCA